MLFCLSRWLHQLDISILLCFGWLSCETLFSTDDISAIWPSQYWCYYRWEGSRYAFVQGLL